MYLDYQLTLQEIHCVVHPESVIDRLNERTSKLASCLVLRVVTAGKSLTLIGKSIASDLAIISRTSLETLDQMVKGDHVLVVNNCVITLDKKEAKWSQWLQQTWNKYSVEGDCVFSCLIRSEYLLSEYEG